MRLAKQFTAPKHRDRKESAIAMRSGILLLAGLLLVAGLPIFASVRILDNYALENAHDRADAALALQARNAGEALVRLGDEASDRATDLSRSPVLQRAFLTGDRTELTRLARTEPGVVFFLGGKRVAGTRPPNALVRQVSLTLDGKQVGVVVATVGLRRQLAERLRGEAPHAEHDRLLIVRQTTEVGTGRSVVIEKRTTRVGGERYRASAYPIPNASGIRLVALRSESAIAASVRPYQQRALYAAIGSFALLMLVGLLFGRPILRTLSDFRRVASQAATDEITGLANRRSLEEELVLEWRRAERIGASLALILADIDDFKSINDGFGHQAGDDVLRKVGEVFAGRVRQVDHAARYGGEEFAVLVPETDLAGAIKLAERLRADLAEARTVLPDGTELSVTASFGVAAKGDVGSAEELVAAADEALYEAKRAGKDRVGPVEALDPEPTFEIPPLERRTRPGKPAPTVAKAVKKKPAKKPTAQRKPTSKPKTSSRTDG